MISALGEGMAQSVLPCSWSLMIPAVAIGLGSRRVVVHLTFMASLALSAWITASGWVASPLWLAGGVLFAGAVVWWRTGASIATAVAIGIGSAWAWRPCVGPELGQALTTAQTDPIGAFLGLALFLVGVGGVGLLIGLVMSRIVGRKRVFSTMAGSVVAGSLGLSMLLGVYPAIASSLARWSTALWA